jgi:hypothetical protein
VLGVGCFALGAIGALVPGLPTTVFLLLGSYFLTRSCPWLERRLRELPLLQPYTKYLDSNVPMPWAAKRRVLLVMWASIAAATTLLALKGTVPMPMVVAIPLAGLLGSAVIVRFRRQAQEPARHGE